MCPGEAGPFVGATQPAAALPEKPELLTLSQGLSHSSKLYLLPLEQCFSTSHY